MVCPHRKPTEKCPAYSIRKSIFIEKKNCVVDNAHNRFICLELRGITATAVKVFCVRSHP